MIHSSDGQFPQTQEDIHTCVYQSIHSYVAGLPLPSLKQVSCGRSAIYMASIAQRWRSSIPSSSSSFLAFKVEKKRVNRHWNEIGSWMLWRQNRFSRFVWISCYPNQNSWKSLPNIHWKVSNFILLPGLEGNDAEGTLGRGTFSVPSISSKLWSNSSCTSSSSSAIRSSWQKNWCVRVIRHALKNTKHIYANLARILMLPSPNKSYYFN